MRGTVDNEEEGRMEQMIVYVLAMVALGWGVRVTRWSTVNTRARVAPGFSRRRSLKRL
jgi:hypothetical protein